MESSSEKSKNIFLKLVICIEALSIKLCNEVGEAIISDQMRLIQTAFITRNHDWVYQAV